VESEVCRPAHAVPSVSRSVPYFPCRAACVQRGSCTSRGVCIKLVGVNSPSFNLGNFLPL